MTSWPSIQTPSSLKETPQKGQIRSNFEDGYVQSRSKWTRSRKVFNLQWNAMSNSDKETLVTFFENNLGSTFTWTHPVSSTNYTVRFKDDEVEFDYVSINYWKVQLTLEEQ